MDHPQTIGRLLIDEALPAELRGSYGELHKRGLSGLLERVAREHPDQYADVSHKLSQLGSTVAYRTGGNSFGLRHLRPAKAAYATRQRIQQQLQSILDDDTHSDDHRSELVERVTGREIENQKKSIYNESLAEENPLAYQVLSGTRGNQANLASLRGSDLLYVDHHSKPIPLPVLHSYSEGLTPAEYMAGTYGARRGVLSTKLNTADAGYFSKILNRAAHRLVVTDTDRQEPEETLRGLPVDTLDADNEGALLARDTADYPRNTVITPRIAKAIHRAGHERILVRSPLVGHPPDGGVYARDVGIREQGSLLGRGSQVGLTAAQSLAEPLTQGALAEKHSGGVAGAAKASGFEYINRLVNPPKMFPGAAAYAQNDGRVNRITEAPAGGHLVYVDGQEHYVPADQELKAKLYDTLEAGDTLSSGLPNPAEIVKHKGIGEGRRAFTQSYVDAYKNSGVKVHRRNVELLSRGLIDHVRLHDEVGDHVPDDIVPYSTIEEQYEPRKDAETRPVAQTLGKYLEKPYLHYTIGTRVRPSVLKELKHFGVKEVAVHHAPPPFEPVMIRGADMLSYDPDVMTQQFGSGHKEILLDAAHRGAHSDRLGTSFVPSLAHGVDFGREGLTKVE